MRAHEHGVEINALRTEQFQYEAVRRFELVAGQTGRAEPILVGDHDESESSLLQMQQRRHHARHQADLLQAVDLLVGRLFVQGSVPVQEHDSG